MARENCESSCTLHLGGVLTSSVLDMHTRHPHAPSAISFFTLTARPFLVAAKGE